MLYSPIHFLATRMRDRTQHTSMGDDMTKSEKAELAFRIAGLVLIVSGLSYLPTIWLIVRPLVSRSAGSSGTAFSTLALISPYASPFVLGACLMLFPQGVSAWLIRPARALSESTTEEMLHIGLVILGVLCLWSIGIVLMQLLAILMAPSSPTAQEGVPAALCSFAVIPPLGLYLIICLRHLRLFLSARAAVRDGTPGTPSATLATGFILIGSYYCIRKLVGVLTWAFQAIMPPVFAAEHPRIFWPWLIASLIGSGVGLIMSAGLVIFAGKLAGWLAPRAEPSSEEGSSSNALHERRSYMEIALSVSVVYLFARFVVSLVRSPFFGWHGTEVIGALAHLLAVPAAVAVPVFFLTGRHAPRVAERFYPGEAVHREDGTKHVMLEVCITIVALYFATHYVCHSAGRHVSFDSTSIEWAWHLSFEHLLAGIVSLLMLVLRSDIAWLLHRYEGVSPTIGSVRRASALRPWLILLGVWFVLADAPGIVTWTGEVLSLGTVPSVPPLRAVPGVFFIFGAGWLSQKLSYGRVIPRIWATKTVHG